MSASCPFELCNATVTMVAELKRPGSNEGLRRVPQHRLGGHEELGQCPASLLVLPLSDYDVKHLITQAAALRRMLADRRPERSEPPVAKDWTARVREPEPYRPGLRPRPAAVPPQAFRPNGGTGGADSKTTGHKGHDRMPVVLTPRQPPGWLGPSGSSGETTTGGSDAVTSVEDVRGTIIEAGRLLAESVDGLFALEGAIGGAVELLNVVRDTSSSDLGVPQALGAVEKLEQARGLLRQAIETGTTYGGTL